MSVAIPVNTNHLGFISCDKHAVLFTFQSKQTRNHPLKQGDVERIFLLSVWEGMWWDITPGAAATAEEAAHFGCPSCCTVQKHKPQWMRLQAPEGESSQALPHHGTLPKRQFFKVHHSAPPLFPMESTGCGLQLGLFWAAVSMAFPLWLPESTRTFQLFSQLLQQLQPYSCAAHKEGAGVSQRDSCWGLRWMWMWQEA